MSLSQARVLVTVFVYVYKKIGSEGFYVFSNVFQLHLLESKWAELLPSGTYYWSDVLQYWNTA